MFFHGYANYEKGLGQQFLKLTSCNTTGLIRAVDMLDRAVGVEKVAITIIRRVADPGDYHRGLTNALKVDKAPSHQAEDLMTIMPHIPCTGILVHTPVTHGHIITVVATPKKKIEKDGLWEMAGAHPRIMPVRLADGFLGNAAMFRWARDLGNKRGDLYEIALVGRIHCEVGRRYHVCDQYPAGSRGDSGEHRCDPRGHAGCRKQGMKAQRRQTVIWG